MDVCDNQNFEIFGTSLSRYKWRSLWIYSVYYKTPSNLKLSSAQHLQNLVLLVSLILGAHLELWLCISLLVLVCFRVQCNARNSSGGLSYQNYRLLACQVNRLSTWSFCSLKNKNNEVVPKSRIFWPLLNSSIDSFHFWNCSFLLFHINPPTYLLPWFL